MNKILIWVSVGGKIIVESCLLEEELKKSNSTLLLF